MANYCSQTLNGIQAECNESALGGILELYIANKADVTIALNAAVVDSQSVVLLGEKQMIDTITMASGKKFKPFYFRKGNASFTSTASFDNANYGMSVNSVISAKFLRQETKKRMELMGLCLADTVAFVKDANGKYWFFGYDYPINATAASANSGAQMTDGSNYTIELTDTSFQFPYEIKTEKLSSTTIAEDKVVDISSIVDNI